MLPEGYRIENQWDLVQDQELAGRMFEDELELVYAVIEGVEARAHKGEYTVERFRF